MNAVFARRLRSRVVALLLFSSIVAFPINLRSNVLNGSAITTTKRGPN
jgi:hypothetical protein